MTEDGTPPILAAENLEKSFGGGRTLLGRRRPLLRAVDRVSLAVPRGRTVGVVGESGSGKSTLARLLVGLLRPSAGTIRLDGEPIQDLTGPARLPVYRSVQMVFQDPVGALNPRKTVGQILEGPLQALLGMDRARRRDRVTELMELVGLGSALIGRYPHALSGGQAQRIGIARALAAEPRLLVLDEPVSALDVSIQAQILQLLRDLQDRLGLGYLFISHDLAVIETLSDTVLVMQQGRVVETGPCRTVFRAPTHAYTRALMDAVPGVRRVPASPVQPVGSRDPSAHQHAPS